MLTATPDLIDEIKRELGIVWQDAETELRIIGILKRAVYKINEYLGCEADINSDMSARHLVITLCNYIWNHVDDEFEKNYLSELVNLRNKYLVINAEEEEESNL